MPDRHTFTVVEIDLPSCANTYGTSPCTAAVGVTGTDRCFNTKRTCQDRLNLVASTVTLRLCQATEDAPYDAIPCLGTVNVTPGVIDPGRSIGTRGKVQVSAADFPTSDSFLDQYAALRAYAPERQGSFWPKLRARHVSLQGAPLRVMRGELGADLSTYRVEHYFIESLLVDADGVDIVAKDALSFCDPKKAQCPVLSTGRLAAAIDDNDISFSLTPAGIGNLEYPSSGVLCLSGKEMIDYTRTGDTISVVGLRGQYGTKAQAHPEDSVAQQVVFFDAESAADIVYSLLVDYTPGIDPAWCNLPAWRDEADQYIGHLYRAIVPAPTSVKTLLDEMMVQAGCSLWWDPVAERIEFQTLRPIAPSAEVIDGSHILESSFKAKEQPDKRVSQHWCYYGLTDPTNKVDKEANFQAAVLKIDTTAEDDYGAPAFDKVLARWIAVDNRPAAERLNAMKVARYRDPPRLASFALFATDAFLPNMGGGIQVQDTSLQNPDGSAATVPFYITSRRDTADVIEYQAEEFLFSEDAVPDDERAVFIDVDRFNVNLRDLYDSLYSSVPTGATVNFTVSRGAYVGGQLLGQPSITVGDWPVDTIVRLINGASGQGVLDSAVLGRGGNGGGYPGDPTGQAGSTAIYTRRALLLKNYGTIAGGGGGGEPRIGYGVDFHADPPNFGFFVAGAGGGAGFNSNEFGVRRGGLRGSGGDTPGQDGTTTDGGFHGNCALGPAGNGGDLAQPGKYNSGADGYTAAGAAIDGVSFVTFEVTGTILGAQIN